MKSLFFLTILAVLSIQSQGQEVIKGQKNQVSLVKGSRATPMVKCKEGVSILLQNENDQMSFIEVKNGKQWPIIKPVNATYGQATEISIDNDAKTQIAIAYRTGPDEFTVLIFKKAEFETDYKQWAVVYGQGSCEFPGNGTVKVNDKNGGSKILKFGDDGKLVEMK